MRLLRVDFKVVFLNGFIKTEEDILESKTFKYYFRKSPLIPWGCYFCTTECKAMLIKPSSNPLPPNYLSETPATIYQIVTLIWICIFVRAHTARLFNNTPIQQSRVKSKPLFKWRVSRPRFTAALQIFQRLRDRWMAV